MMRLPARIFLLGAVALLLAACSREPETGPVELKWDRDTCKRCSMAVSDRHYAVQVRGGPKHQVFKFDDIGCAVYWLKDQPWVNDPATEIWVTDYRSGKWLDARTAHYVTGKTTPMAYGFGASGEVLPGSIGFEEVRKQLLAKDK
ncbi:MAG: nitrous oxide reductase accessory protein NosL [Gammaproteobacteria bacterium]|nr:nitrous oxide reductase accessory protein NosL [Gammaproteobacteria bacterium]MBU1977785.1 nitrous oxide reductase accessory protein NosL [Gammaproteobacteria bacterium]